MALEECLQRLTHYQLNFKLVQSPMGISISDHWGVGWGGGEGLSRVLSIFFEEKDEARRQQRDLL